MKDTKYIVKTTTQFKNDFKLAKKRGLKMELLREVIPGRRMENPSVRCFFVRKVCKARFLRGFTQTTQKISTKMG